MTTQTLITKLKAVEQGVINLKAALAEMEQKWMDSIRANHALIEARKAAGREIRKQRMASRVKIKTLAKLTGIRPDILINMEMGKIKDVGNVKLNEPQP